MIRSASWDKGKTAVAFEAEPRFSLEFLLDDPRHLMLLGARIALSRSFAECDLDSQLIDDRIPPCREGCAVDIPLWAQHPAVSHSLHFDQLWVSVLSAIYCKKRSFFD